MKKPTQNLLVGAMVRIDYPVLTNVAEAHRAYAIAEASKRPLWNKVGLVVAVSDQGADGTQLSIKLEDGSLVKVWDNFVSITALPPKDRTEELLEQILAAMKSLSKL